MNKRLRSILTLLIALIVVVGAGYYFVNRSNLGIGGTLVKDSGDKVSDYSAVFLTNGQVYFGKMYASADNVDLRDIYYLQVNQQENLQSGSNSSATEQQPDISLVKLGNELHGPNDRMHINRDQVLFTESLKNDSKVVKAIEDFKE
ncbi:MAG TPA: hypothetical protein VLA04_02645 [Verrucomicrobiae bacterium]|nr:hypothetical protein [Verrucomicrobiae bacterium]